MAASPTAWSLRMASHCASTSSLIEINAVRIISLPKKRGLAIANVLAYSNTDTVETYWSNPACPASTSAFRKDGSFKHSLTVILIVLHHPILVHCISLAVSCLLYFVFCTTYSIGNYISILPALMSCLQIYL